MSYNSVWREMMQAGAQVHSQHYHWWNPFQRFGSSTFMPPQSFLNRGFSIVWPPPPHGAYGIQKNQNDIPSSNSASRDNKAVTKSHVIDKKKMQSTDNSKRCSVVVCGTEGESSFWTSCTACKTRFEYRLMFLNEYLKCQNCEQVFQAVEIPPPSNFLVQTQCFLQGAPSSTANHDPPCVKERVKRVLKEQGNNNLEIKRRKQSESLSKSNENDNKGIEQKSTAYGMSNKEISKRLTDLGLLMVSKKVQRWRFASEDNIAIKETNAMSVPDSDFHDFDKDVRTLACFKPNEMWAVYDDDDGMPRHYALIRKVISLEPFKLEMSWVNSKSNTEFGPLGKNTINPSLNSFSHRIKWEKRARGVVQIHPAKGDVWALYKNWSTDWSCKTSNDLILICIRGGPST